MYDLSDAIAILQVITEYLMFGNGDISGEMRTSIGKTMDSALTVIYETDCLQPKKDVIKIIK